MLAGSYPVTHCGHSSERLLWFHGRERGTSLGTGYPLHSKCSGRECAHRTSAGNRLPDRDLWIPLLQVPGHMRIRLRCISWQWLLGIERIPIDHGIRNLLAGCPAEAFAVFFVQGHSTHRNHNAFALSRRLGDRFPVALDGSQFHCSNTFRYDDCSTRKAGQANRMRVLPNHGRHRHC